MLRLPHAAFTVLSSFVLAACARPAPDVRPSGSDAPGVAWRIESLSETGSAAPVEASAPAPERAAPLRLFLRGGPKTHGPGQHDHPRFVAEWEPLLEARGAVVEGALRFPTAEELARTDVLVIYAADGGAIHGEER
ncbi:MAG: hypothetical protein HZA53_08295, partial [Planctomycetes bacterium]|nr:hypothetical protein [Planctomycetota bacterium]